MVLISSLATVNQVIAKEDLIPDFLPNLPPWEEYEAPPERITTAPPVFIQLDFEGNAYREYLTVDKAGTYSVTRELVTDDVLIEVSADRTIIFEDREAISQGGELIIQGPQAASSYTCPIPSSFSIVGDSSGVPISNWKLEDTSKPAGTTTQWVVFDFWTENYRDRGSHMPVVLFWDEVLHGWGAILGDNHISSDGCGSSARFNSQVEGFLSVGTPPANPPTTYWQNAVYSSTCGNEMYDGYVVIVPLWYSVPRYRLEMQASTGHWVSYRIFEYSASLGDWEVLTDWQTVDTDTGNWYDPPPLWTPNTEGIFFGATPASSSGTWSINISNTQCGWF